MKTFDSEYKEYITKMIEQSKDCQSVFPKNHLYKILLDNKIFFDDSDEKNPFSYYYCKENECAVRETNKVFNGLGKIALLFRALKDNKYIYWTMQEFNKRVA